MLARLTSSFLIASALVAAVPAPALAAATPPVVTGPTAADLTKSIPTFRWSLGPAGELVNYISIRPTSAGTEEEPMTFRNLGAKTSFTLGGALNAGTYAWNAGWATASGQPYENGVTPDASFTIKPMVQRVSLYSVQQTNSSPLATINGQYFTNIPRVNVSCTVTNGRTVVAKQVLVKEDANSFQSATIFHCSGVRIPESLDGKTLKAVLKVYSGRTSATFTKAFVAR